MKKLVLVATTLMVTFGSISAFADDRPAPPPGGDRPEPPSFSNIDTNGDGVLTKDELRGPFLEDFDKLDVDGSGSLTEDELPKPPEPR
ncbi:hypothetical protein [uncultured Vibrio sp.]|uniref:hypothetical protein n=1 Tax=Vibrio sp. TaxID=678 RepID=UPI0029C95179|nr:hypothetical protein [uncultured Vibrio sp.]